MLIYIIMLGQKKDKSAHFLGLKSAPVYHGMGSKLYPVSHSSHPNPASNGIIEQHQQLDQYAPVGLKNKSSSKKSGLEK